MNKICFREEAKDWNEALPIGNGFLGAMVFGKTGTERLQINEDSVWTGSFMERVNPDARENYTKVRELLLNGEIEVCMQHIRICDIIRHSEMFG